MTQKMIKMTSMNAKVISTFGVFVAIVLCAPLAIGQSNAIQACRNAGNGQLRQVAIPGDCKENETPVT